MTMATAMLSPRARPAAKVTAAAIPERAAGTTARRTTCHSVAPSAIAASRSVAATPSRAVRLSDTMVGGAITASTTAASSMLGP